MSTSQSNTLEQRNPSNQWLTRVGTIYEEQRAAVIDAISTDTAVNQTINVAGFDLVVTDTDASKAIREKLVAEVEASENIRKKLALAGITPIAILAEDIFNNIVSKAKGLYTFKTMNAVGEVTGNGEAFAEKLSFGGRPFYSTASVLLGIALPVFLLFFLHLSGWYLGITIGYAAIVAMTIIIPISIYMQSGVETRFIDTTIRIHTHISPIVFLTRYCYRAFVFKNKKKILWPERIDLGSGTDRFKLILPVPPQHVAEKLMLCHKHNIKTFLVADQRSFDVVIDKKKQQVLREKYDPIICHEEGRVIAVIDQFGDFQQEKEIIDYVTEHFSSIQRSFVPVQKN
jgi:VIT1/CCC1 family predicted Fe2+/Mn2+ transporter